MDAQRMKRGMAAMIPFGMMFGTLCMILIVGINGVPGRFMGPIFEIDNTDLSIPSQYFAKSTISVPEGNITAADLQLADKYSFYLWNYATTTSSKTTFHQKGWDYVKNVNISEILENDGNSTQIIYISNIREKIRISQRFFLPALISVSIILGFGIVGALGYPISLLIVSIFTAICFLTSIVLAVLITLLILEVKDYVKPFKEFGLDYKMGTSALGVVWLAVVHILAVGVMWLLMAVGVMKYNTLLKQRQQPGAFEEGAPPFNGNRK